MTNRNNQTGRLTERRDPEREGAPRSPSEPTRDNEVSSAGEFSTQSVVDPALASPRFSPRSSNRLEHSVELHIEELVLNGFDPASRSAIGEALERELARLLTEQGAPAAIRGDGEIANLDGGAFELSRHSAAETIGVDLAKAVYGGLKQ